jgi:magnesium-transporting ATPase (P-type)
MDSDSEEEARKRLKKGLRRPESPTDKKYQSLDQGLTLVSIFGIKDPLREGIKDAVKKC